MMGREREAQAEAIRIGGCPPWSGHVCEGIYSPEQPGKKLLRRISPWMSVFMGVPWREEAQGSGPPPGQCCGFREGLCKRESLALLSTYVGCNDDCETLHYVQEDLWPRTLEEETGQLCWVGLLHCRALGDPFQPYSFAILFPQ